MKHLFIYTFLFFLIGCKFELPEALITRNCNVSNAITYSIEVGNNKKYNFILSNLAYLNSSITWQTSTGTTLGTSIGGTFSYTFTEGTHIVRAFYRNLCGDNVTLSTSTFTILKTCAKPTGISLVSSNNGKYIFKLDGTTFDVASVIWKTTNSTGVILDQITNSNFNNFETTVTSTDTYKTTAEITTFCGEKLTYSSNFSHLVLLGSVKDIYICGYDGNRAVYWKNGEAVYLSDGKYPAKANTIKIIGNDIYVGGFENNGTINVARYWKNGIANDFKNSKNGSIISMDFNGVDLYSVAYFDDGLLWVYINNNVLYGGGFVPRKILYYGTAKYDIYLAGHINDGINSNGYYTKLDANFTGIKNSKISFYNDIDIVGSDIYLTGSSNNISAYWKNGNAIILSNSSPSQGKAMVLKGNDIFISGQIGNDPVYWKNGNLNYLNKIQSFNGTYQTNGIDVNGTNLYIVGTTSVNSVTSQGSYAVYWLNGSIFNLSKNLTPNNFSGALDIFITTN